MSESITEAAKTGLAASKKVTEAKDPLDWFQKQAGSLVTAQAGPMEFGRRRNPEKYKSMGIDAKLTKLAKEQQKIIDQLEKIRFEFSRGK